MKSEKNKIHEIYKFIRDNGIQISKAKSAWGSDRYKFGNLYAMLEDDGSTIGVESDFVNVRDTLGKIYYLQGDKYDLEDLYDCIFSEDDND